MDSEFQERLEKRLFRACQERDADAAVYAVSYLCRLDSSKRLASLGPNVLSLLERTREKGFRTGEMLAAVEADRPQDAYPWTAPSTKTTRANFRDIVLAPLTYNASARDATSSTPPARVWTREGEKSRTRYRLSWLTDQLPDGEPGLFGPIERLPWINRHLRRKEDPFGEFAGARRWEFAAFCAQLAQAVLFSEHLGGPGVRGQAPRAGFLRGCRHSGRPLSPHCRDVLLHLEWPEHPRVQLLSTLHLPHISSSIAGPAIEEARATFSNQLMLHNGEDSEHVLVTSNLPSRWLLAAVGQLSPAVDQTRLSLMDGNSVLDHLSHFRSTIWQEWFGPDDLGRLLLRPRTPTAPATWGPASLLEPSLEAVAFDSQLGGPTLDQLDLWLSEAVPVSVAIIYGRAGSGKTRLLQEWAKRQQKRGWRVGAATSRLRAWDLLSLTKEQKIVLFDNAGAHAEQIARLLDEVSRLAEPGMPRLRIVLAARAPFDWGNPMVQYKGPASLIERATEINIAPLPQCEKTRATLIHNAYEGFVEKGPSCPASFKAPDPSGKSLDSILGLHMTVLAAIRGNPLESDPEVLDYALDHEREIWWEAIHSAFGNEQAASELGECLERMITAVSLVGPLSEREADSLVSALAPALSQEKRKQILSTLRRLLPPDCEHVEATVAFAELAPDALATHLLLQTVGGALKCDLPTILCDLFPPRNGQLLLRLLRVIDSSGNTAMAGIVEDLVTRNQRTLSAAIDVLPFSEERLSSHLGDFVALSPESEAAKEILEDGRDTPARLRLAIVTARSALKMRILDPSRTGRRGAAWLHNRIGTALILLGHPDQALEHIQRAVELLRTVAKAQPPDYVLDLAAALTNLATLHWIAEDPPGVRAALQDAVSVLDKASSGPVQFYQDLVVELLYLCNTLAQSGSDDEFLCCTRWSVELLQEISARRRADFRSENGTLIIESVGRIDSLLADDAGTCQRLELIKMEVLVLTGLVVRSPYDLHHLADSMARLSVIQRQQGFVREAENANGIARTWRSQVEAGPPPTPALGEKYGVDESRPLQEALGRLRRSAGFGLSRMGSLELRTPPLEIPAEEPLQLRRRENAGGDLWEIYLP